MSELSESSVQSPADLKNYVRTYFLIGAALVFDMGLAVGAYYAHAHGAKVGLAVILALAAVKLAIVAFYFRHLISSKKAVYGTLALTFFFFLAMLILFLGAFHDKPFGSH